MIRAAHLTGAATITFGIVALLVSVNYDPTASVTMIVGHLRAATIVAAILHVGARVIVEIRASHGARWILRETERINRGRGD